MIGAIYSMDIYFAVRLRLILLLNVLLCCLPFIYVCFSLAYNSEWLSWRPSSWL